MDNFFDDIKEVKAPMKRMEEARSKEEFDQAKEEALAMLDEIIEKLEDENLIY